MHVNGCLKNGQQSFLTLCATPPTLVKRKFWQPSHLLDSCTKKCDKKRSYYCSLYVLTRVSSRNLFRLTRRQGPDTHFTPLAEGHHAGRLSFGCLRSPASYNEPSKFRLMNLGTTSLLYLPGTLGTSWQSVFQAEPSRI